MKWTLTVTLTPSLCLVCLQMCLVCPSPPVSSIVDSCCAQCHCVHPGVLPSLTVLSVRLTVWSPLLILVFAPQSQRVRAFCSHALLGAQPTACCCLAPLSFQLLSPTRPWSVQHHTFLSHGDAINLQKHTGTITAPDGDVICLSFRSAVAYITSSLWPQVFIPRPCLLSHVNILAWLVLCLRGSPVPSQV
jgi:hypothetical protein